MINCIEYTENGIIIIESIQGPGDSSCNTLNGAIKIVIRDNGTRKWPKKINHMLMSEKLHKTDDLEEIEWAICGELARKVGPFDRLFFKSE